MCMMRFRDTLLSQSVTDIKCIQTLSARNKNHMVHAFQSEHDIQVKNITCHHANQYANPTHYMILKVDIIYPV